MQTYGIFVEELEFGSHLVMQCALFDKLYLQTLEVWENERAQKEQLMKAMVIYCCADVPFACYTTAENEHPRDDRFEYGYLLPQDGRGEV